MCDMFLFRGEQEVKKGTYWEPNENKKIVLNADGFLPGDRREWYFKLPESYLLIPMFLFALALSMAFPYGIGAVIFVLLYALYRILFFLSCQCERLVGSALAHIWFRYKPTISFFSGHSKKRKRRGKK